MGPPGDGVPNRGTGKCWLRVKTGYGCAVLLNLPDVFDICRVAYWLAGLVNTRAESALAQLVERYTI
jgi:hypothetical protein